MDGSMDACMHERMDRCNQDGWICLSSQSSLITGIEMQAQVLQNRTAEHSLRIMGKQSEATHIGMRRPTGPVMWQIPTLIHSCRSYSRLRRRIVHVAIISCRVHIPRHVVQGSISVRNGHKRFSMAAMTGARSAREHLSSSMSACIVVSQPSSLAWECFFTMCRSS